MVTALSAHNNSIETTKQNRSDSSLELVTVKWQLRDVI